MRKSRIVLPTALIALVLVLGTAAAQARTVTTLNAFQLITSIRYVHPNGQPLPPPGPGSPPIVGGRVTVTTQDYAGNHKRHSKQVSYTDHLDCVFTSPAGMANCNAQIAVGSSMLTATDVPVDLANPTRLNVPINGGTGKFRGAKGGTSTLRLGPNTGDITIKVSVGYGATGARGRPVGAMYTQTNGVSRNALVKFDRYADGTLRQRQTVRTRGRGAPHRQPCSSPLCPIVDTQGAVHSYDARRLVFATNAGSNTISVFRDTSRGLKLVDVEPSRGRYPSSLTRHGNRLYVLNSNTGTVAGFRIAASGRLRRIAGSVRSLSTRGAGGNARQIGFDRTGTILVVTQLVTGKIDTFRVSRTGRLSRATPYPSVTPLPFGFAFDPRNRLVVSTVTSLTAAGDTGVYGVSGSGGLTLVDSQSSNGAGPCWVAITNDGKYAFVSNTGGGVEAVVTRYGIGSDGKLNFLGLTQPLPGEFARTDLTLSDDSRYLYVLAPDNTSLPMSHIDQYRVGADGSLELIGATPSNLPPGLSGLDGR